jgi:small subunit ribosomal protein S2
MATYIYMERNGIYIIDLQQTVKKFTEAYDFVKDVAADGKGILFVGTKKQAQETIREEAQKCGMYFVNQRWLGGMLTNYKTIRKRVNRLKELEKMEQDGSFEVLTKKEAAKLANERKDWRDFWVGSRTWTNCPERFLSLIPGKKELQLRKPVNLGYQW